MRSGSKSRWQQVTTLVSLSTCGAMTGFSFAQGAVADMTSPASLPVHLLALQKPVKPAANGGATLTGTNGNPQVQPGLEGDPANCARYTGSAAVVSRAGYPNMCAMPVSTPAGQAALVSDIYQKWFVGAGAVTAQNAAVLFENADDPGNSQVQAILKTLPGS